MPRLIRNINHCLLLKYNRLPDTTILGYQYSDFCKFNSEKRIRVNSEESVLFRTEICFSVRKLIIAKKNMSQVMQGQSVFVVLCDIT